MTSSSTAFPSPSDHDQEMGSLNGPKINQNQLKYSAKYALEPVFIKLTALRNELLSS